jgi:hypothetical protein
MYLRRGEGGGRRGEGGREGGESREVFYDTRRSPVPISDTTPHKRVKNWWNLLNDNFNV